VALVIENRVLENTSSTGTGALTLEEVVGYRRFASAMAIGDTCHYAIESIDQYGRPTNEWEYGVGTYSAGNTLTRSAVAGSSNAGAPVNFGAGEKRVVMTMLASLLGQKADLSGAAFEGAALTKPKAIAFSATPTFDASQSNVFYLGAMTANVTDITIVNPSDGQTIGIRFVMDATGGRLVTLPSAIKAAGFLESGANRATWLNITYVASASRWEGAWSPVPA